MVGTCRASPRPPPVGSPRGSAPAPPSRPGTSRDTRGPGVARRDEVQALCGPHSLRCCLALIAGAAFLRSKRSCLAVWHGRAISLPLALCCIPSLGSAFFFIFSPSFAFALAKQTNKQNKAKPRKPQSNAKSAGGHCTPLRARLARGFRQGEISLPPPGFGEPPRKVSLIPGKQKRQPQPVGTMSTASSRPFPFSLPKIPARRSHGEQKPAHTRPAPRRADPVY